MTASGEDFTIIAENLQKQIDELTRIVEAQQEQIDSLQGRN